MKLKIYVLDIFLKDIIKSNANFFFLYTSDTTLNFTLDNLGTNTVNIQNSITSELQNTLKL